MKTKYYIILAIVLVTLVVVGSEKPVPLLLAKLTVQVVDEQHMPIQGARVNLTFMDPITRKGVPISGLTDASGVFAGEGGSDSSIGGIVQKNGYYSSGFPFEPFRDAKDGRWQPWNPTYVSLLRKIEKPIPMYARSFRELTIPEIQKPCGFDLEVGDWLAPYGKGKVADFIMTLQREYENRNKFNVSVVISFSNPLDGIQEVKLPKEWQCSEFEWPRLAPETGYQPKLSAQFGTEPGKGFLDTASDNQAYFFRVRTVEQNGKIVSALYGKIKGGISLEGRETKTCSVAFTYYLNPTTLDRNMEFDLKRNLFTNLPNLEQPRLP
jgi:hypothetical protein